MFFLLDVSASMTERDRQLAKTFFFWVAAGLRREYHALDIVFVAHTTEAWEFSEADFFKVTGSGGTVASVGFAKVREIMHDRYNASKCNIYLFYASDGDNAADDREPARAELEAIAKLARYSGYLEVCPAAGRTTPTETLSLFQQAAAAGAPSGQFAITGPDDVAAAVRHFFAEESKTAQSHAPGVAQGVAP